MNTIRRQAETAGDSATQYAAVCAPGGVGLHDRAEQRILCLRGADRRSFLQGMVSNDVLALQPGQGCHAAFLDPTGHLLADLNIYAREEALLLETDRRCLDRLAQTLDRYLIMEQVEIDDVSVDWAILSVLGDGAPVLLAAALEIPIPSELPPRHSVSWAGGFAARSDLGFVPAYDLWLPAGQAPRLRERLRGAGATALGGEAAEMLRIAAGLPAWGRELDETVLLPEAEMDDAVSYTKGCYIGQEIVARLHARGHVNRVLRRVELPAGAALPQPGDILRAPASGEGVGREAGRITSAAPSPEPGGGPLALAYVRREFWDAGTPLEVQPAGAAAPVAAVVRPRR